MLIDEAKARLTSTKVGSNRYSGTRLCANNPIVLITNTVPLGKEIKRAAPKLALRKASLEKNSIVHLVLIHSHKLRTNNNQSNNSLLSNI